MNPKRSFSTLRRVFAEGFAARDLAETLVSFDADQEVAYVRGKMREYGLAVAGVRQGGRVVGYILDGGVDIGRCGDGCHLFTDGEVLPDSASYTRVLATLCHHRFVFLALLGDIGGVLSRHDLEKPPMRMWLFGMVTIVEMELARRIHSRYPQDQWRRHLTSERLAKAEYLLAERRRLGHQASLIDCLQLGDKVRILIKDAELSTRLGFATMGAVKETFKRLEHLRNDLAHSQEIVIHDWEIITSLTGCLDAMFRRDGGE